MRLLFSTLILISLVFVPSTTYAEIACGDVSAGPEATPTASPQALTDAVFPEQGGELKVFAAASLTDAFNEIAESIMAEHPEVRIVVQTAGSQTLVTQLQEGAPADVLATANTSTMDNAVDLELIQGEPTTFTGNRLVIVTPASNPAGIESIDDLANEGIRLVVANAEVPVGRYGALAICAYDGTGNAPDGFLNAVNANIVSEEPDVRHVLAKVQLGEADAGVVYASDAVASELAGVGLQVIEFPANIPVRADYPIAVVQGGNTELAEAFIAWVMSDQGQAILQKYGFE